MVDKYCLTTVGATVGFKDLTSSVLSVEFWQCLVQHGFTHLRVQTGPDIAWASQQLESLKQEIPEGLSIDVFESRKNLLKEEMMLCKAQDDSRQAGLVICHAGKYPALLRFVLYRKLMTSAGTGTILDGWRLGLSLVVVPNTSLLDDHQTEMAKHLAKEGYATMSSASISDLKQSLSDAETLAETNKSLWPAHDIPASTQPALRLWQIAPSDVQREQDEQMNND